MLNKRYKVYYFIRYDGYITFLQYFYKDTKTNKYKFLKA